jgi:uncharacterized protein YigA (DUF484 family)
MIDPDTRDRILARPEVLLDDTDVMQALIGANERAMGGNIIDLRGIAMERLEQRLDKLEDTHRTVIAAAYENLAGTNQVHRAILQLLDPVDFPAFLEAIHTDIAATLRVERVRLVLESKAGAEAGLAQVSDVIHVAPAGFVADYLTGGRGTPTKPVVLRQVQEVSEAIYGDRAVWIRSEAVLRLDLGAGRLPGLLALGAEDPHQFKPTHGTDLLAFFAGAFERIMRKWLS